MYFRNVLVYSFCLSAMLFGSSIAVATNDPVCARVKIEIRQELTLERQAFDAKMKITNTLDTLSIDDVSVDVSFADEDGNTVLASSDPNNTDASFFIRIDSIDGISNVSGTGSVAPATEAEIHWLIIPAPGAAGNLPDGKVFFVGATLSYTVGGVPEEVVVTPDFITVKPLPRLTLDYFLTQEVIADDPLTLEIEPIEPYTLGVRVQNNGIATAQNLKIDSAQPEIIENEQGLLIDFQIIGSFIDDQPAAPTLLIDFGDIPGNSARMGRWIMTTSLAGEFVDFTATFSHADELGGALTSILDATNAHFLLRDVRVDEPGRDTVRDFLAIDGDVFRVYESDSVDTVVTDHSASANFPLNNQSGTEVFHTLTIPVTSGFMYVKLTDPYGGTKVMREVVRSDGKRIPLENAWASKHKNRDTNSWEYYVNFFDSNTTGTYTVHMGAEVLGPIPPALQYIPNKITYEGNQTGFLVEASDPNGQTPILTATPLPGGAVFVDNGNGSATFNWTPADGQAGTYSLTFNASDGTLSSYQAMTIQVNPAWDTDGDGMDDAWELQHFGNLDRDGTGDFDGDGISDLQEFLDNTNPAVGTGLTRPIISTPLSGTEVDTLQPELVLENSVHAPTAVVTYNCEVYLDEALTTSVTNVDNVAETVDTTSCNISTDLDDNTWYYWRARATDGDVFSQWVNGEFFVNTANDAPDAFNTNLPLDGSITDTDRPLLEIINAVDVDGDVKTYGFEVYSDAGLTTLVTSTTTINEGIDGTTSWLLAVPLSENGTYYWRGIVTDENGAVSHSNVASFTINTTVEAPGLPGISSPFNGQEVISAAVDLVIINATDPDNLDLVYRYEIDTVNSFDSADLQTSADIVEGIDTTSWAVTGLIEDATYYWRVMASNGTVNSVWVTSAFLYNAVNSVPGIPIINNPDNLAWVESLTPTLSVNPSVDVDGDSISYEFELYFDSSMITLADSVVVSNGSWSIDILLEDNSWSYWRARAVDEHGLASEWTALSAFFVNNSGTDDPPVIALVAPATDIPDASLSPVVISWTDDDPDSNASIALYYDTDTAGTDGMLIVDGIEENLDAANDSYSWDTSALAPGTYYIYAIISDALSSSTVYLSTSITVPDDTPSPAGWMDVTSQISLNLSNPIISRRSPNALMTLEISNPGTEDFAGPLRVVFTDLTPVNLVSLAEADGVTDAGDPYIDLAPYIADAFEAGESTGTLSLTILGGGRNVFNFLLKVEHFQ